MKLKQAAKALGALAQESRLEVFRLLVRCGLEGQAAGQIAKQLDVPAATLSFHLKELTHAGLIEARREGRSIIYTLNVAAMRSLFGYLMDDCCQGRPELCRADDSAAGRCGDKARSAKPRRKKRNTAV